MTSSVAGLRRSSKAFPKVKLASKKVRKSTRPTKYNLNQSPYEYVVAVTNRFKGLDRINSVPEELWWEIHNIVQEAGNKTIQRKRKARRQSGYLRRPDK